ncbi:MAG: argininosuccinate lyase [Methanoregulaceae archaeon]|nr:argininosuccinate lyase [Methanoregulaceae archaeon]
MKRLWDKGGDADAMVMAFTVGDDFRWDARLVAHDIRASQAHARMLASCGHVESGIAERIIVALAEIGEAHARGEWEISPEEEDCHTAIENRLAAKLGDEAGWVHLGRSRNDQVLTAMRLYVREACESLAQSAESVVESLFAIADAQGDLALPGYTHLQRAMPSTVGLWAEGFATELRDDAVGLRGATRRALTNPLGSAAGYGTPGLSLDRSQTASELGFSSVQEPVTAAQLSRGKAEAEVAFQTTLLIQDLGRLASDLVLYATAEFGFVALPERFTTGSSIMPQKRNPDVFELVRAHSAQASSDLLAILNLTAKMTSGYHRDLQQIKPPLFGLLDRAAACAEVMAHVLPGVRFRADRTEAAMDPSLFATEEAYRLCQAEGIPFREAYRRVGAKYRG